MGALGPDLPGYDKQVEEEKLAEIFDYIRTQHGRTTIVVCSVLTAISSFLAPIGISDIYPTISTQSQYSPLAASMVVLVVLFTAVGILIFVHENIHGVVFRIFGHAPTIRYREMVTWADEELVSRNHLIVSALAPFAILTPISYLTAVLATGWELTLLFSLLFIFNVFGSGLDLINTFRAFRQPKGTMYWTKATDDGLVGIHYIPLEGSNTL